MQVQKCWFLLVTPVHMSTSWKKTVATCLSIQTGIWKWLGKRARLALFGLLGANHHLRDEVDYSTGRLLGVMLSKKVTHVLHAAPALPRYKTKDPVCTHIHTRQRVTWIYLFNICYTVQNEKQSKKKKKKEEDLLCIQTAISCPSVNEIYSKWILLEYISTYWVHAVCCRCMRCKCVIITFCLEGPEHRIWLY